MINKSYRLSTGFSDYLPQNETLVIEKPKMNYYAKDYSYQYNFDIDWNALAKIVHADNVAKGFWPPEGRNFGEMIALAHSEISEAAEDWDGKREPDAKVPQYMATFVEIADCMIRLLDTGDYLGADFNGNNIEDFRENEYGITQYRGMAANLMQVNRALSRSLEAYRKTDTDGAAVELVIAFWLCLAIMAEHNQDAHTIIQNKLTYNRSRPFKHGKKF